MSKTNPARGMRDFLPADVRKRNYVIGIIKEVYENYGFEPLETPAVENLETLTGKYGEEGNQLIFKILKRGEKLNELLEQNGNTTFNERALSDLALRYDLTVPLARVVANNKSELPKFFKRYQIQPVWRADRPARGRFREFYQCDVDCIGSESMIVEAEIISAASEILARLGLDDNLANFHDFAILFNHRDILYGILDAFDVPSERRTSVLVAIDKADKIGWAGVGKELSEGCGFSSVAANEMIESVFVGSLFLHDSSKKLNLSEQNDLNLEKLEGKIGSTESGKRGIAAVRNFLKLSVNDGSFEHLRFQPSLARGLSYYTGSIFEIGLNRLDFAGSIGGGGRYDGLIGMFGKEQIPACGFSLGLERILVVMDERGMFPPEIAESTPADVMVTLASEDAASESLKLASELREAGLRVTLYPEADKLGKQIKYADSIKVPWVCVLGESEIADGAVTLKNMRSGEQQPYPRGDIASKITR